MRLHAKTACYLVAAGLLLAPTLASATNGYFLIGYGAKSRSMGGVGVAYGQDGLAAAANPAAMTDVEVDTMRIDVGAELFTHFQSSVLEGNSSSSPVSRHTPSRVGPRHCGQSSPRTTVDKTTIEHVAANQRIQNTNQTPWKI